MKSIKEFFKQIRVETIIRAILLLVMAILFFIHPETAMVTTVVVFSTFILVDGIVSLFIYLFSFGASGILGTTFLGSVFKILFGILFLSWPGVTTVAFAIMFAIYIIVISCGVIEEAFYLKRLGSKWRWIVLLVLGFATLVGGITMIFLAPANLVRVSGIIAGVTLTIACIEEITLAIYMYRIKKAAAPIDVEVKE